MIFNIEWMNLIEILSLIYHTNLIYANNYFCLLLAL